MASPETVGAMPPPVGVTPDFSGRRTKLQNQTVVVYAVLTALSSLFIFLRMYTRAFLVGTVGLDDYLITLSWLGCIAWYVACVHSFQFGFGEHLWNVPALDLIPYFKMLIGICVIYVWTPALTKFSLLVLYHRINPGKWVRMAIYGVAAIVFGYSLAITIVVAGPCNPLTRPDGECLKSINLFMAIINIITDFLVLALPFPMLNTLQLPMKQKVMLGGIFSLGSCVTITSIVRIVYIYHLIGDPDATYQQAAACMFSAVELNTGVVCGCLVILKPFFQRFMPYLISFSSGNRSRSGSHGFGFGFSKKSAGRSYELRSAEDSGEGKSGGPSSRSRAIEVMKEYEVRSEQGAKMGYGDGNSSTDDIISGLDGQPRLRH